MHGSTTGAENREMKKQISALQAFTDSSIHCEDRYDTNRTTAGNTAAALGIVFSAFTAQRSFVTILYGRYYYYFHFTKGGTKAGKQ